MNAPQARRLGALVYRTGRVELSERLRKEQLAQQASKRSTLSRGECAEKLLLVRKVRDHSRVDGLLPCPRKGDERATSIAGIRKAFDQTQSLDPIDPVGHRARREHDGVDQARGTHLVWGPRSDESCQHLELAERDAVAIEDRCEACRLEQVEPRNALQDMGHRHIQLGALAIPLGNNPIDRILLHAEDYTSTWRYLTTYYVVKYLYVEVLGYTEQCHADSD